MRERGEKEGEYERPPGELPARDIHVCDTPVGEGQGMQARGHM